VSRAILPDRPRRRTVGGLFARLALLVLVVGVPVALSAAAGGPSVHLDPGALWRAALHHRPGDVQVVAGWLGRAAVLMAWFGWAWLTICVGLEARAWLTGRSTVRLPASRSLQWVAAVLVGTAFAVGTSGRAPAHHVTSGGIHASPAHGARFASSGPGTPLASSGPGAAPDASATEARDGVWDHPPFPVLTDGPPPRVPWDLQAEAVDGTTAAVVTHAPAAPVAVAAPTGRHRVSPRETLWSVAESRLGEARRWREIADLNYAVVQPDGSRLAADHWILPGWELLLPATGPPVVAGSEPTSTDPSPGAGPDAAPAVGAVGDPVGELPFRGLPVSPIGAGIVGVGVADLVDRLRRVQQRHRGMGALIRLPEPALRTVEQRLRVGDGRAELEAAEAAVEMCGVAMDREGTIGRLRSVVVTGTHVRLTFDAPVGRGIPAPFTPGGDPATVEVERAALEVSATRRRGARRQFPAPALVTVGRTGDELLMVNLEGVGSLVLGGDPHANESVGRAMAVELATSRWAAGFDLVLIGFGVGLERCERVAVVADAGPVSADLSWRRLTTGMRLDELGVPTADAARRLGGGAGWEPVVVVCGPGVPWGEVEALVAVGEDGRCGIGIVVISGPGAPSFDGAVVVRPDDADPAGLSDVLGTLVAPQRIEGEEAGHLAAVIEAAAVLDEPVDASEDAGDPDAVDVGRPDTGLRQSTTTYVHPGERTTARVDVPTTRGSALPSNRAPGWASDRASARHRSGPEEGVLSAGATEVEVAVLGPVEIRGAARGFTRAWATELVVYLALHPGGAANETWATALWPERLMAPSSLHSTASVARRSLGTARDGSDHLPRSHGRLALAPTVGTDWDRFQDLAASDDPERWQEALTLVRGRPFDGMGSTDWSILDGTAPAIESAVVDVSGRLAGARLRAGDPRGAEWSARRGLLVSPYDERLYRMLLRAADAAGNPGGVEAVMAELVRVVADEIEPIESVHPSTLALYRSLSRRPDRVLRATVRGPVS
jgi:DNA-binding SARP family transcriptional activator